MQVSANLLGISANVSLYRGVKVTGVNSFIRDDRGHCLFWDFDDIAYPSVCDALEVVQSTYSLPTIHVLQSSDSLHFFAYCFRACSWPEAVSIVSSTQHVDWRWVRLGVVRGFLTLRITAKDTIEPVWVGDLESSVAPDCQVYDLPSFSHYWTHFEPDGTPKDGG